MRPLFEPHGFKNSIYGAFRAGAVDHQNTWLDRFE
jgi:hypothetical protein